MRIALVDGGWANAQFAAQCDKPCEAVATTADQVLLGVTQGSSPYENVVAMRVDTPSPLPAGYWLNWEIRSKAQDQITVTDVKLIAQK